MSRFPIPGESSPGRPSRSVASPTADEAPPVAATPPSGAALLTGVVAYTLWGVLPVYWKWLQAVPAFEVLCHRMLWSLAFLLLLIAVRDRGTSLRRALAEPANWRRFTVTAVLLGGNWFTYIWAVQQGRIVDCSLGYFLNPLVTVALGMVVLGERLNGPQWVSVGFAAAGVAWLAVVFGALPWVSVVLAVSFALYTLLRKTARLGSVDGLVFEALLFLPLAAGWLWHLQAGGLAAFWHRGWTTDLLLAGAGVTTSVPLLLFNSAARRLDLVTVGLLQYLSPTFQFALGVFLYGEPFQPMRLIGFALIWAGIAVYAWDGWRRRPGGRKPG